MNSAALETQEHPMRHLWISSLLLVVVSCGGASSPTGIDATSPATPAAGTPASMFDPAFLHQVQVTMSPGDWEALRENFRDNEYYAANVTIDGGLAEQVGVRSRGEGSRSGTKPALKLDFNKYVKGRRFQGQKSIAVKNLVQDDSMMRDYLAMTVFEAMGIAAPRYSFTRVTVNGQYVGLYNIVECIEEPFLAARFGNNDGTLYNYQYGVDSYWDFSDRGIDPDEYIPEPFEPETDGPVDAAPLVDFVLTANYEPDETLLAEISKYLDVDRFLTYVAIENALAEHDGFVGDQGMNNFFLYQLANSQRFVLIPWDKNTALTDASWPLLHNLESNVLTRRLTAYPAKMKVYRDAVARAGASFVNARYLVPKLDQAYALVHEAALADPNKPYSNAEFEGGIGGLRGLIGAREADILAQVR
jgi:spore coat protein CotH